MKNETDAFLMQKIALGDQDAFSILLKRYSDFAISFLKKRNARDPKDIAQEAFIKVWRFAPNYEQEKALFKTWFFKILTNEFYRSIEKKDAASVSFDVDILASGDNLEKEFEQKQEKEILLKKIEALSPKLREVFMLRHLDFLKDKEIASYLGLSLKAVESRLMRAKEIILKKG